MVKAAAREKRAARARRDDAILAASSIRTLHRKAPINTPNVFPPPDFTPGDRHQDEIADHAAGAPREAIDSRHCYVCKEQYSRLHAFYDQLCPDCAAFNFTKRTELADLRGRVALLTGGRVKIGYQAGLKLLRCWRSPHRDHQISTRLGDALCARARLRRVERPAGDLRSRSAPHAECRIVLPSAADDTQPARLHRQQRLPDGAAAARFLRAHDGGGNRGARRDAGARRGRSSARTRGCADTTCCQRRVPRKRRASPRADGARRSPD